MTKGSGARSEVGTNRDQRDEGGAKDGHGHTRTRTVRSSINGLDFAGQSRKSMSGESQPGKP